MNLLTTIAASLAIAGSACAQPQPGFWLMGMPPGATQTQVMALSADGSRAAGWTFVPGSGPQPGFTWTKAGGRFDFGLEPGMPNTTGALGMNSDGSVIAGYMATSTSAPSHAFRRVGSGPVQDLGLLPFKTDASALGVSGDGGTVVGYSKGPVFEGPYGEAFRWTESGGMQGLGYLRPNGNYSAANAISRDGTTIVGMSRSNGSIGDNEAFRWTDAGGMQALPGLGTRDNEAFAVSDDGRVAVGSSYLGGFFTNAVRWVDGVPQDLGRLEGYRSCKAFAVSGDGAVVGGVASFSSTLDAFVWTKSTGMLSVADFLTLHGVEIPVGYHFQYVFAISGDGLTVAGTGRNAAGIAEGFVATIPAPSSGLVLLLASAAVCRRRRG